MLSGPGKSSSAQKWPMPGTSRINLPDLLPSSDPLPLCNKAAKQNPWPDLPSP